MVARFEYQPASDIDLPLAARLGQYPRQPDLLIDVLRGLGRRLAAGLVRLQYSIEVVGAPPDLSRVALIANHQSHLDTLAVLAILPERQRRRVTVLAARDYFFTRWQQAIAPALLGQAVAFDRTSSTELRRWIQLLQAQPEGWFLAYPSGTRRSSQLHSGLLLVLARSGWPIVPVAIAGTRDAWPVDRRLWRPFKRLRVTFGAPITEPPTRDLLATLEQFWQEHAG